MRLPQELFAEALWLEWDNHYGIIIMELSIKKNYQIFSDDTI